MKRGYRAEHEAMWQRPAKCEKVSFIFSSFPLLIIVRLPMLHMLVLRLILPLIAKHPHLISFIFHPIRGGKHQLPPADFSWIPYFSFAHLIKSCQFPPQITSSGPSRQRLSRHVGRWKSRRGGVVVLMCWEGRWQSGDKRTVSIYFSCIALNLLNLYSFTINAIIRRMLGLGKIQKDDFVTADWIRR